MARTGSCSAGHCEVRGRQRLVEQAAETSGPFRRRDSIQPGVDELLAVRVDEDVGPPERVLDELEPLGSDVRRGSSDRAEVLEDAARGPAVGLWEDRGVAPNGREPRPWAGEGKRPLGR